MLSAGLMKLRVLVPVQPHLDHRWVVRSVLRGQRTGVFRCRESSLEPISHGLTINGQRESETELGYAVPDGRGLQRPAARSIKLDFWSPLYSTYLAVTLSLR